MNFEPSEEQSMLVDAIARMLAAKPNPARMGELPDRSLARARWREFGDLGVLMLAMPGGDDDLGTMTDWALLLETAGEALAREPVIAAGIVARDLLAGGGSATAERLERLLAGEQIVAPSVIGSIVARQHGGQWLLNGQDSLVLAVGIADWFIVLASDDAGTSHLFLVDPQDLGCGIGEARLIDGSWGAAITFADTPAEFLCIADPASVTGAIARGRVAATAELLGVMGSAVKLTAQHLKTRVQFGHPLSEQQALRHLLADMVVATEMARSHLHVGLAALHQEGQPAFPLIAAIRHAVGELAITSCEQAIQLHGGMGMTEEHIIGQHLKRAMVLAAIYPDR